jgi:hypothetical protein
MLDIRSQSAAVGPHLSGKRYWLDGRKSKVPGVLNPRRAHCSRQTHKAQAVMKVFMRKHPSLFVCLVIFLVIAGFLGWDYSAGIRGQLTARFDVARGRFEVLAYGLPAPWRREWASLMRERYGIEMRIVAGCALSQSLAEYADGYNQVSGTAAIRRFGRDVFREVEADAVAQWKSRGGTTRH